MRLCLLVVFVSCLGQVRSVRIGNGTDIEGLYTKLLEKMIRVLEDLVERTDNPSPEDEDRVSCIYGLNALFRNLGSSWSLDMIDSSSKLQAGILNGNLMDLGGYDQCVEVKVGPTDMNQNLPKFTGQHCLISNNIYLPNASIVINGETHTVLDLFGNPYISLTMAQCYPSLCKPYVIQEGLNGVFSVPDNILDTLGVGIGVNVSIDPSDCHVAKGPPYDALDWVVLAIILLFLFLGLISTAVDYFYIISNKRIPNSSTLKLLGSFSFYTNANKLFSLNMPRGSIPSLNALKFFSMCWVILGHRYMYFTRQPINNYADVPNIIKDFWKELIVNGPMAVDTFFLISGMLNMYGFLHTVARTKRYTLKDLLDGYLHRYLRLTPAYLMMIGFTATWLYRLRDGPLWDRFVGDYKDICRQTYWANIVYLNNYLEPENFCMMQSWYLAADMQLYWLSPFVMYPLWRWPKYGWAQLLVLTMASIISPFLVSWYGHIAAPVPVTSDANRRTREMAMLYFPMHTKSVSYVLGIGGGYILYKYRKGELNLDLDPWKRVIGWLLCAVLMLYALFGGYYALQMDYKYNQAFSAFFIGFQRFFWSSGLLWLIFMCVKGYGGFIDMFLSWKVFIPLAKLSYSVYLTHIVILMCSIAAERNSFKFNDYDQVEMFLGDVLLCTFSGLVLTLLVEVPMLNIERILLPGRGGRKKPTNVQTPRPSAPTEQGHLHVA
ncbi:nose resistant to fluoxetine protein 6 isoform X2 [Halyomorpha halys]|uniref:nose resistant to fluoxetine protein 6 isoform X2 n=1 Tax=Halyomorpha halys TaxID=286706 RepID=UPI0006D4E4D3|nr:nose resistant to fluoxetine protein 6 [Halyomorpha halys]